MFAFANNFAYDFVEAARNESLFSLVHNINYAQAASMVKVPLEKGRKSGKFEFYFTLFEGNRSPRLAFHVEINSRWSLMCCKR